MSRRQGRATPVAVLVVLALCALWVIPTLGILITSFRTSDAVNGSGWWTVFTPPWEPGQLTVASHRQAWFMGMGFSFLRFPGRRALLALIVGLLIVPTRWRWPRCCASTAAWA